ncbi:MAG: hypothetical protein OEM24_11610, partial [Paracoccaceae bacterium]|nr:hypothetical protein [Paracoccaceae bacterium]
MTDPILTLEAPLLFDAPYGAPDYRRFLERLNDRLKPQGLRLHQSQTPIEGTALFSGRNVHILISPSEAPLPAEDFTAALASPVNEFATADFAELVAAHSCHLGVSVGDGPFLKTQEMIDLETKLGVFEEVKPAELGLKTRILHMAVLSLLDTVEPLATAIHWRQSDMLQTPDTFRALPESDLPGPLIFTPEAITRGTDAQGQPLLGFEARGVEAFCGRKIVLEPAPFDFQRGVELVADLVARHAAGTIDLTSGGEIALSPTVRARVAKEPSGDENPEGRLSVSL